jgi:hypothetical protein
MKFEIHFVKTGRGKAQCPPNPNYPNGVALDGADDPDKPFCTAELPYPAPECGMWFVKCEICSIKVMVTAAGRPDDPRSVKMNCDIESRTQ